MLLGLRLASNGRAWIDAYVPQFDIPALDQAGRQAWAAQGVVVHPIRVAKIYRYNGAVRCLVNVVGRAG